VPAPNAAITKEHQYRATQDARAEQIRADIEAVSRDIERLEQKRRTAQELLRGIVAERNAQVDLREPIDIRDLRQQVEEAQRTNADKNQQQRQRELHQRAVDELTSAQLESETLTKAIDQRTKKRADAIARAQQLEFFLLREVAEMNRAKTSIGDVGSD
jgi:hypothetical protein